MELRALRILALMTAIGLVFSELPGQGAAKAGRTTSSTNRAKLGTTQLSGENAQVGTTYTLGKDSPVNVTLNRVEYTVGPVRFGNNDLWPKKTEKLLVLHYTLHNPQKGDLRLAWNTINITAVDANDKNWRFVQDVAVEGTHEKCHMSLKPAQKTKVYTCIIVPAAGEIPKVIFESLDRLVLRYNLKGKAAPLPAPIADPADASGATALERVPGSFGEYYPMQGLFAKVDSAAFWSGSVEGRSLKPGARFMEVVCAAKNEGLRNERLVWSTFKPRLSDADGIELRRLDNVYSATRDAAINTEIEPGQEIRFRYFFEVPGGAQVKSFTWAQIPGREYTYDLTAVQ